LFFCCLELAHQNAITGLPGFSDVHAHYLYQDRHKALAGDDVWLLLGVVNHFHVILYFCEILLDLRLCFAQLFIILVGILKIELTFK